MTTVTQERNGLARIGLRLRRRNEWGSSFNYSGRWTVSKPAARVFVHISVTNPGNYNSNDAHARALEQIGRVRFPSTGVSYNRGIMPNAARYELQPIGRQGAHTVNDFRRSTCTTSGCPGRGGPLTAPSWNLNVNSRAYVICQNVQHSVSDAMVDSIAMCIAADMLAGHVSRSARIHGHRCVSAKSCPGDRMWSFMGRVKARVDAYLARGRVDGGGTTPPPPEQEDDDMSYSDWPKKDRDALIEDLRRAVANDRTLDYVNPKGKESRWRHQVARAHQNSHNTSRSSWVDRIARAVALMTNGVTGKTLSAHIRRGDLSEARLTSRVSGNKISAATALLNAQEKATDARNEGRARHAEVKAMLEAMADQLDALVPGLAAKVREVAAEVAREEAARVNAADVADQLEVVVADEDRDGEDHDAEVLAAKADADAAADAAVDAAEADAEDAS